MAIKHIVTKGYIGSGSGVYKISTKGFSIAVVTTGSGPAWVAADRKTSWVAVDRKTSWVANESGT